MCLHGKIKSVNQNIDYNKMFKIKIIIIDGIKKKFNG